jgi:cytochrome oxidase Cu insertion factor (SCO1/SenC/PrrC family)
MRSRTKNRNRFVSFALLLVAASCARRNASPDQAATAPASLPTLAHAAAAPAPTGRAELGQAAPDFELSDLDGHKVRLSAYRGKPVVLEWFNPGCPYVKASHTKGSLHGLAEKQTGKGVIWLAINSAAPGKQGYGVEANLNGKEQFGLTHPILIDETGTVGKAYGAKHTPHIFVIDTKGVLVYRGGIDNSPDGEGESPRGGSLVNYAEAALDDLASSRPVHVPESEAYGCSVKYGSQ